LSEIIQKCLQKKQENRPSIEEIIFSESFQGKAKLCKITLPLEINKSKLLQKLQSNQVIKSKIDESNLLSLEKKMAETIPPRSSDSFKSTATRKTVKTPSSGLKRSTTSIAEKHSERTVNTEEGNHNPFDMAFDQNCNSTG
jgi:hypothetical protein